MAENSPFHLRNKIIYSVYVRNYGENGTFEDVINDLERIKNLAVDIIWFLPVHPIGCVNRKGSLGCPYSVEDYRQINHEYGTLQDFKQLIDSIHDHGMQVMMDVVYNYTSYDSQLYKTNPDWFYRKPDGNIGSKIDHCNDVIDLDYSQKELWDYQIETLKYWVNLGIDGFRCDLAQLIPLEFWRQARAEVAKVKPEVIWLADSISPDFMMYLRENGFSATSDCEMYQVFDMTYDYDLDFAFRPYLRGDTGLDAYVEKLRGQEIINPANYVKLRFLENHDQERAKLLFPANEDLKQWTAFLYFQRGAVLLYAGQEAMDEKSPSLFDKDKVNWSGLDHGFSSYLRLLGSIKKDPIFATGRYTLYNTAKLGVITASYEDDFKKLYGIFNVERKTGLMDIECRDGVFKDLINGMDVVVNQGKIKLLTEPVVFETLKI